MNVSNVEPEQLDRATEVLGEPPFANQVGMHPLLPQRELREYAEENGTELVAYSPLARGEVFEVSELSQIVEKHGVSEAQVSLAWLREKGVTPIPKATGEEHTRDNWASLGLELDEGDVERIDGSAGPTARSIRASRLVATRDRTAVGRSADSGPRVAAGARPKRQRPHPEP